MNNVQQIADTGLDGLVIEITLNIPFNGGSGGACQVSILENGLAQTFSACWSQSAHPDPHPDHPYACHQPAAITQYEVNLTAPDGAFHYKSSESVRQP